MPYAASGREITPSSCNSLSMETHPKRFTTAYGEADTVRREPYLGYSLSCDVSDCEAFLLDSDETFFICERMYIGRSNSRQITSPSTEGKGSNPPKPKNRLVEIRLETRANQKSAAIIAASVAHTPATNRLKSGPPNERTR